MFYRRKSKTCGERNFCVLKESPKLIWRGDPTHDPPIKNESCGVLTRLVLVVIIKRAILSILN